MRLTAPCHACRTRRLPRAKPRRSTRLFAMVRRSLSGAARSSCGHFATGMQLGQAARQNHRIHVAVHELPVGRRSLLRVRFRIGARGVCHRWTPHGLAASAVACRMASIELPVGVDSRGVATERALGSMTAIFHPSGVCLGSRATCERQHPPKWQAGRGVPGGAAGAVPCLHHMHTHTAEQHIKTAAWSRLDNLFPFSSTVLLKSC